MGAAKSVHWERILIMLENERLRTISVFHIRELQVFRETTGQPETI